MFALIQKSDNAILRIAQDGPMLAEVKPVYWTPCPDECTTAWTFDGEGFTAPVIPQPSPGDLIRKQIVMLESTVTARRLREAVIGIDGGWLASVDAQIAALRAQL